MGGVCTEGWGCGEGAGHTRVYTRTRRPPSRAGLPRLGSASTTRGCVVAAALTKPMQACREGHKGPPVVGRRAHSILWTRSSAACAKGMPTIVVAPMTQHIMAGSSACAANPWKCMWRTGGCHHQARQLRKLEGPPPLPLGYRGEALACGIAFAMTCLCAGVSAGS